LFFIIAAEIPDLGKAPQNGALTRINRADYRANSGRDLYIFIRSSELARWEPAKGLKTLKLIQIEHEKLEVSHPIQEVAGSRPLKKQNPLPILRPTISE
jgi:hypothetical protein